MSINITLIASGPEETFKALEDNVLLKPEISIEWVSLEIINEEVVPIDEVERYLNARMREVGYGKVVQEMHVVQKKPGTTKYRFFLSDANVMAIFGF